MYLSTPSVDCQGIQISGKRKSISELKKSLLVQSRMIAKNSNFCSTSNRRAFPIELMKTKMLDAAGFPVTSKDKTSIPFEDRLDNYILQVLRIVGFFVVLSFVWEESVYFLLKSLSHVHHAVFLILVLLQRNQDVDLVVLEHLFLFNKSSQFFSFRVLSSLVAILEWSSKASSSH